MKGTSQILTLVLFSVIFWLIPSEVMADGFVTRSVLAQGKWFRIAVTQGGVYKIDYNLIKNLGLENPEYPRIFGNNMGQLSYYCSSNAPDDLKELAIYVSKGSDGIFNDGDYILFYAQGTDRWLFKNGQYEFLHHNYSDTAYYFLTSGTSPGKMTVIEQETSQPADYISSESDILYSHESDDDNIIKSGREWFQPVSYVNSININPGFSDLVTTEGVRYDLRVVARASVSTQFRLYEGETLQKSLQVPGLNLFDNIGTQAIITDSTGTMMPGSASPSYSIAFFNNGEASARGWLDYLRLQGRRKNIFHGGEWQFSDYKSISTGRITSFSIQSDVGSPIIWDVSDPFNVKEISYNVNGDNISFKSATDSLRTFLVFTSGNASVPVIKNEPLANQDLHGSTAADMIIITHPLFRSYADKLADLHLKNNGLVSLVVPLNEIYNEFSGGVPDIAAIRNFVRMKYLKQKDTGRPLKYLLLFGDGSYENRTPPPANPNFIPTYQSQNSNVVVSSFTSDDFYGLLEDGEGEADGTLEIGVGRLPVSDTIQAGIQLEKIKKYLDPSAMGDWRNMICLTADDEDGNTHMIDAEDIAAVIKNDNPAFSVEKIYLDAFKQSSTVSGDSYPDVNKAINDRINSGCLIFNYIGHGSETGLAAERVVRIEDINSWNNAGRLPLFVTATCEFSRFDDIELNVATREMTGKTSAGEMVLLNKNGGAIALMSTTRLVYSAPNHILNKNIFNYAFTRDSDGNAMSLGDIIRLAKNSSGSGSNKRNFTLLGDPALKLAYPWHGKVVTDSVNGVSVGGDIDTLKALSVITVSGHIEDTEGKLKDHFAGTVSPVVFDKETRVSTLANDGGQVMDFYVRNNIVFSGKTMADNGRFRFSFIVPRDINYSFGNGKISYYASDENEDMNGEFENIIVGGFADNITGDTTGPEIQLYMNDTLFRSGGITDNNPGLLAMISDSGGINATGSGIGHDITAWLDDDPSQTVVLNNYFENEFDNYTKGKVIYGFSGLSNGTHKLTLKAWDNYNNSSQESILFNVEPGDKFILKHLINYPNPFAGLTRITAEHNRPGYSLSIEIRIYNLGGKLIKIIRTSSLSSGYTLQPVTWDGNDDGGQRVGRGIYPYVVIVTTREGEMARVSGRMIIL